MHATPRSQYLVWLNYVDSNHGNAHNELVSDVEKGQLSHPECHCNRNISCSSLSMTHEGWQDHVRDAMRVCGDQIVKPEQGNMPEA